MSVTEPEEQNTPSPSPPATPPADPPEWARELKQTIEALPGKLRASLSDDDKSSIAEAVHGLFERSGAFASLEEAVREAEQETETTTTETEQTTTEPPPKKGSKWSGFAARFAGEGD